MSQIDTTSSPEGLAHTLRQMLAVLELERQALAALDLDAILGASVDKTALCGTLDRSGECLGGLAIDEECRGLLDAARRMNDVNRQVRNLLAANVSARLDALTGSPQLYRTQGQGFRSANYSYAGARR